MAKNEQNLINYKSIAQIEFEANRAKEIALNDIDETVNISQGINNDEKA